MPTIRYKIPLLSVQALLAYAKEMEKGIYTYHLNKIETESTFLRRGDTLQDDNAIFFQTLCVLHGDDYAHPYDDAIIDDLYDVIVYLDFTGIFDRDPKYPKAALRQKKAEDMFRPEGITLDLGIGAHRYLAFERSASMSRNARLSFIREDVYEQVRRRMMLDMEIGKCQLSKLYAYNGLLFSSGTRIESERLWNRDSIVVIDNPQTLMKDVKVITVEDVTGTGNVRKYERVEKTTDLLITEFDGEGLISPGFAEEIDRLFCGKRKQHSSFQIRMPYIKGMVHKVDFKSVLNHVGVRTIRDLWGRECDLDDVCMILTKSQCKGVGWLEESGYHWYRFLETCKKYRHALYITGVNRTQSDTVELNYQFLNTVSMSAEEFRPADLPDGWERSPADFTTRRWLTKTTEQKYYDLCADTGKRIQFFLDREEVWHLGRKSKQDTLAKMLRKNPLLIHESIYADELDDACETLIKNYSVGKLLVEGENRYLSGDLMKLILHMIDNAPSGNRVNKFDRDQIKEDLYRPSEFYMASPAYEQHYANCTMLRNPHIARNEEVIAVPFVSTNAMFSLRDTYMNNLKGVVMVNPSSLMAERLGGADYDGDMVKIIVDPTLNAAVNRNYGKRRDYMFNNDNNIPILQIPTATPQFADANDWHERFLTVRNTFSSRVGQISNAALDRSIVAYNENDTSDPEYREQCRRETETLAILTGLEIDSAKSGIKPDLSDYLGKKIAKRTPFLKYKALLEKSGTRRAWYEPTFEERFKEFFATTEWQSVNSNLERLPLLAKKLKENTPKAKQKPAAPEELFTFAQDPNWRKYLNKEALDDLATFISDYERCLKRIRASRYAVKEKQRKGDVDRILFSRGQSEQYDTDELYALFVSLPPERIFEIKRAVKEQAWHFLPEDERYHFLADYLPDEDFQSYYALFADFRCSGYKLLPDIVMDYATIYESRDLSRLHFDGDSEWMKQMMDFYIEHQNEADYREVVACIAKFILDKYFYKKDAVKYVVALGKRKFLWDVLWEYVPRTIMERR